MSKTKKLVNLQEDITTETLSLEQFKQELINLIERVEKDGKKCIIAYNFMEKDLQAINLLSTKVELLEFPSSLMRWASKMERFIGDKAKLVTSELQKGNK